MGGNPNLEAVMQSYLLANNSYNSHSIKLHKVEEFSNSVEGDKKPAGLMANE